MSAATHMDGFAEKAGAYVHIPFCSAVCPYCDFAVVAGRDDLTERYCDAVVAEIERDTPWNPLDAVYFGGGTPSRIPVDFIDRILRTLEIRHGLADGAEISLEANPEDFTAGNAEGLRTAGFNRISFGAQSFDVNVLLALGRRHGPDQIGRSVATAREAGFGNVSVDLIYGTPGETAHSWIDTLESAVANEPDHVSCYALTVEPGTPLGRRVRAGAPAPDPDTQADRSEVADRILTQAGLVRYEVSNWSKPGMECVYNAIVWAQGGYVAYGNGAHRFRAGTRSRNVRRLETYLSAIEDNGSPVGGAEEISGWDSEIDRLFVGLRRTAGVFPGPGGAALAGSPDGVRLVEAGVLSAFEDRVTVNIPMLTDEVLRAVVALEQPQVPEHGRDADIVGVAGD